MRSILIVIDGLNEDHLVAFMRELFLLFCANYCFCATNGKNEAQRKINWGQNKEERKKVVQDYHNSKTVSCFH